MKHILPLILLFSVGCVTSSTPHTQTDTAAADTSSAAPDAVTPDVKLDPAQWHSFEAGPFTVPAGKERFLCYSHTLEEDLWVDQIVLESRPVVHHVIYAKTTSPDPDGFFECDVLFQNNWSPIFVAGTGDASITMPEKAGHVLKKGTQLTMQLHLLNATLDDVTDVVPIRLRKMPALPEKPIEVIVFGHMGINLPPGETSDVVSNCPSNSDMKIFSVFPHMHLMGRKMVVETGPGGDSLSEVFRSDPYDFDKQSLTPIDLTIKAGDTVKVTCTYENYLDQFVTFGESTTNEMCFFVGFATGADNEFAGCIETGSDSFFPEACGDDPPNDIGLGATCSAGGGECEAGLLCTEDLEQTEGLEMCIGIGCSSSSDCGEGGVCCAIQAAGDVSLCLPPSCVLSVCEILE